MHAYSLVRIFINERNLRSTPSIIYTCVIYYTCVILAIVNGFGKAVLEEHNHYIREEMRNLAKEIFKISILAKFSFHDIDRCIALNSTQSSHTCSLLAKQSWK